MSNELMTLGNALEALDSSSTPEELAEGIQVAENVIGAFYGRYKELRAEFEEQLTRILKEVPEITAGGQLYYLGKKKTTRQKPNFDVMCAILDAAQGDTEKIVDCLKASAFKPGTTRKLLGKDTEMFFDEFDEKIEKKVQKIPTNLLEKK